MNKTSFRFITKNKNKEEKQTQNMDTHNQKKRSKILIKHVLTFYILEKKYNGILKTVNSSSSDQKQTSKRQQQQSKAKL